MIFELKLLIAFTCSISLFAFMQYKHKKKCEAADRHFKMVMESLAEKAEREKQHEQTD